LIWQRIDEHLSTVSQLALRDRPEIEVLNASRERIGDSRQGKDVRRPCEQELATGLVAVEASLDREKQPGHTLDLIDHRRPGDTREEAHWICSGCVGRWLVIQSRPDRL
jgi:hypothetical protein